MILDRSTPPQIHGIDRLAYPEVITETLDNGIRLHSLNIGTDPLVQITVCVRAGMGEQNIRLANTYTAKMLNKGTGTKGAQEVSEIFDFYGSWFGVYAGKHVTQLSLLCLRRHLENVIDLFRDVIVSPSLPEAELKRLLEAGKSLYRENTNKVAWLASQRIQRMMFGNNSIYGRGSDYEDYDLLTAEHIRSHHEACYYAENMDIVLSGMLDAEAVAIVRKSFGQIKSSRRRPMDKHVQTRESSPEHKNTIKKEGVQSAVFVGRPLFGVDAEDTLPVRCLSLVFGGYFGSRLMSNIREEKGYTYGISSDTIYYRYDGALTISTQCDNKYAGLVIKEIYAEMERLKEEMMQEEEIETSRNYALGEMLRSFEGFSPWSSALCSELSFSDFTSSSFNYIRKEEEALRSFDANLVMQMAKKYFDRDAFYEVVVGEPVL